MAISSRPQRTEISTLKYGLLLKISAFSSALEKHIGTCSSNPTHPYCHFSRDTVILGSILIVLIIGIIRLISHHLNRAILFRFNRPSILLTFSGELSKPSSSPSNPSRSDLLLFIFAYEGGFIFIIRIGCSIRDSY